MFVKVKSWVNVNRSVGEKKTQKLSVGFLIAVKRITDVRLFDAERVGRKQKARKKEGKRFVEDL